MKKNWTLFLLSVVLIFALTACQPNPKESFTSAYMNLLQAKTYEFSTDLVLNLNIPNLPDRDQKGIEDLNNSKITITGKTNTKTKETEMTVKGKIKIKGKTMDLDIPVFIDEKKQLGYLKLDGLADHFGILIKHPDVKFDNFKGKFLEFPLHQDEATSEEKKEQLLKSLNRTLDQLSDRHFKEEDLTDKEKEQGAAQKITVSLNDQLIKSVIQQIFKVYEDNLGEKFTKNDLDDVFKHANFKKSNWTVSLDDHEKILNQQTDFEMGVDVHKRPASFKIKAMTSFSNMNGEVKFNIPEKQDIVTLFEFKTMVGAEIIRSRRG
ncbi:hypothetical protein HOO54_12655 [Bacillus sp. WMMC1349]|uniref:hypothetical protein n=1 Tax=Bacillus sp. WMMC1349 TaxID=2736254 RepID=UPI001553CB28|nr:hypothetical protein [Bacillus sp. WMMC1349]NPC93059.1 hypothetical protein [Bacillus sp. WMMC1349]